MRKITSLAIVVAAVFAAANAVAGEATDKVTGEFMQSNCWGCVPGDELSFVAHRLISAHEAFGKHQQKGFMLSVREDGAWWEMDFGDPSETCVHVYADGVVRMGGLVTDGQRADGTAAPQIGRYFGVFLADGGEPAYYIDHGVVYRFSTDRWSTAARNQFFDWCDTGALPSGDDLLPGAAEWPNVVFEGNLQVHNSPKDGD
jgi:hypothetical protein